MGDNTKQVRVDNWGIFFLQRLQMFFSKTDYCDMTLQFEGNVQLKVHRLVMNACTEYFQFLEQTCALEENVIMMPSDLQADVIVPIVNFMYTGMLEFHFSLFERLYKTAQMMNITILMKLLEAQKQPFTPKLRKKIETPIRKPKLNTSGDLPATLPGRKLPVWKRKSLPALPNASLYTEMKWTNSPQDPLSLPDNTPKPTRFEWPDEDLPNLNLMETSFEDISYTSKPLLTRDDLQKPSTSFDDLKHLPNNTKITGPVATSSRYSPTLDMEDVKTYVKEQKIRNNLNLEEAAAAAAASTAEKRKGSPVIKTVKKVRLDDTEKTTTISIATEGKQTDINHEKIVSEILKKYPQLVKKNKNIRLKIMAKNAKEGTKVVDAKHSETELWVCTQCTNVDHPVEFKVYYMYRKHMTEVHHEKFDAKQCKYCGHQCSTNHFLMYHSYTKHAIKPSPGFNFPKCDRCPYIALSPALLQKHKLGHGKNETQCRECKLAFMGSSALASHIQATGHSNKATSISYECQYCSKQLQNSVNLFMHIKSQHRSEARRDGIVSIDDAEDSDEIDDREEYILPEMMEARPSKVNILSNVKVDQHVQQENLSLEPSSEAEALNNVATGIATSLGLVDIVVFNDNNPPQLFLQPEQPEFILPEMNTETTTDGVIEQNILTSTEIASTDELVMVLTDHDYGDNQEEVTNDNSNIVVLYSHPVDGQQEQFITSQSNIMVNSQTGLIEIRNGTTTLDAPVSEAEEQPESIELIQREIESHNEAKAEEAMSALKPESPKEAAQEIVETRPSTSLVESLEQGQQVEFVTAIEEEKPEEDEALIPEEPEQPETEEPEVEQPEPEPTVDVNTQPSEQSPEKEESAPESEVAEPVKETPPESVPENEDSSSQEKPSKIAILDDWEDTDSQQSDHKEEKDKAERTVNKLMDDWEEEDEDEKKA